MHSSWYYTDRVAASRAASVHNAQRQPPVGGVPPCAGPSAPRAVSTTNYDEFHKVLAICFLRRLIRLLARGLAVHLGRHFARPRRFPATSGGETSRTEEA